MRKRDCSRVRSFAPAQSPLHPQTFWACSVREAISKWNDDPTAFTIWRGVSLLTAFAVVPLMFVVVELATVLLGEGAAEQLLLEQVQRLIGEQGAQAIAQLLDSWQKNGAGALATMMEVAVLFFALGGAFDVLQDALNSIWGVKPKPEGGTLSQFRRRFLSISGVLGTAFLLLVSLVLVAGVEAFASHLPGPL